MISLPGDAIVTAPNTITGSIGVIAGWAYNKGLKEKLGLSTSRVQVGRHADLPFGMTLPLLGLRLPDRTFTEDESARMEHTIRSLYEDFVAKVASSRHIAPDSVEVVAQGRVWSGQRAVQLGLADQIGGLEVAIALAKEKIGLSADETVELMERPRPKLFSSALFHPRLLGLTAQPTPELDYLHFASSTMAYPCCWFPPTTYRALWGCMERKPMSEEARALYADMGATPVINALGPHPLRGVVPPPGHHRRYGTSRPLLR